MNSRILLAALLAASFASLARAGDVSLTVNGKPAEAGTLKPADVQSLVISSGDLVLTFGKDVNGDFSATSVVKGGQELAHNLHGVEPRDVDAKRSFYLDYGAGRGHLNATAVKIVKNTPELAHFAVIDDGTSPTMAAAAPAGGARGGGAGGRTALEHHFIMQKDASAVFAYAIVNSPRAGGEMRTMYRFDRDILDWAWNVERTGQQPKYAYLQNLETQDPANLVQDETWKLPDGTIYQKYDYCAYYAESPMWGHYGHGFGVWFIPVSAEYYAGGPFRQDLIIHQDALILNYIGGGHFSGGGAATAGSPKMFGPWCLYFNKADTPKALIDDALKMSREQQAKWPYRWVDEPLYPLQRTTVTGQLKVADGRSPAGAWVVLAKPGGNVYGQGGDFIYSAHADAAGKFSLPNVRPGNYALYAWATQGTITDELEKDGITVAGAAQDLGEVAWTPTHHNSLLWQIGKSDRMSGEFKFGDQLRNIQWVRSVPADLTFTIGQSKDAADWYFAQAKPGNWDVKFTLDKVPAGKAYLTIAFAGGGGGPSLDVLVNGTKITTQPIAPGNDATTYRAALRSGRYLKGELPFEASLLKTGENTIRFANTAAGNRTNDVPSNGLMYDTIILESD